MGKMDYRENVLPDIEMYGGNTDTWQIPLYRDNNARMRWENARDATYTLVIKDYGYTHKPNGATYFTLTKTGRLEQEPDGNAVVIFQFDKNDTLSMYGKYTYQIIAEDENYSHAEQGTLFITKNINQ